jgi:hypothetical protein
VDIINIRHERERQFKINNVNPHSNVDEVKREDGMDQIGSKGPNQCYSINFLHKNAEFVCRAQGVFNNYNSVRKALKIRQRLDEVDGF